MVDSAFCTVGTANLNSRSLRYDYETNAFIFDPSTTNQLNSMFERDKKNSTLLTPEMWKKRSGWKKFLGWVGNLLTLSCKSFLAQIFNIPRTLPTFGKAF